MAASFLGILRSHFPELAQRYHIRTLGIFGSYVRNEQTSASDLDVLVEYTQTPSLFRYLELEYQLTDLLGVKVDLIMKEALKPAIGERVLREVVSV